MAGAIIDFCRADLCSGHSSHDQCAAEFAPMPATSACLYLNSIGQRHRRHRANRGFVGIHRWLANRKAFCGYFPRQSGRWLGRLVCFSPPTTQPTAPIPPAHPRCVLNVSVQFRHALIAASIQRRNERPAGSHRDFSALSGSAIGYLCRCLSIGRNFRGAINGA